MLELLNNIVRNLAGPCKAYSPLTKADRLSAIGSSAQPIMEEKKSFVKGRSSIGRASVSKAECCGFKSLRPCSFLSKTSLREFSFAAGAFGSRASAWRVIFRRGRFFIENVASRVFFRRGRFRVESVAWRVIFRRGRFFIENVAGAFGCRSSSFSFSNSFSNSGSCLTRF